MHYVRNLAGGAMKIKQVNKSTDNFHIYTFGGLKETNKWLIKNNYA